MKIIFMGTPDFAVPTLEKLYECGYDVECVFSQPDKPKGRGYKLTPPPVKVVAESHNTKVLQPVSLKKDADEYINELKTINPDVIVVAAYGKIQTGESPITDETPNLIEVMACEGGCIAGPSVISNPRIAANQLKRYVESGSEG